MPYISTSPPVKYDNLSTAATVEELRIGDADARSTGTWFAALTGGRRSPHMRQFTRMFVVVAACAVVGQGARAGLNHVRSTARPIHSVHKEVVEDFSFPKPDFNYGKALVRFKKLAANLTNPLNITDPVRFKKLAANLTNPLNMNMTSPVNLTSRFNFTVPQWQRLKDLVDDKRFNFTEPLDFTKLSNVTPPQMQKLKELRVFLPSSLDMQHEYYDSGKVVLGSWHWPSCDKDHMEKCSVMAVHGCCCKPGFVYVEGNAGVPIAKGAAAGAAAGGLITGALLGGDVGASTASGAASGAVGGAVTYLVESGECNPKEHLSKLVQSHLS